MRPIVMQLRRLCRAFHAFHKALALPPNPQPWVRRQPFDYNDQRTFTEKIIQIVDLQIKKAG